MNTNNYFEEIGFWPAGARGVLGAYIVGFALSLLLTIGAYVLAVHALLSRNATLLALVFLACTQFLVQMYFFLHITDVSSRARLYALLAAGLVVLILVSGSLWIMITLSGRMMDRDMQQYMNAQQGI